MLRHLCLGICLSCADDSASDGSTSAGTGETGAEEGGPDGEQEPGPDGPGCSEPWEGWWDEVEDNALAQTPTVLGPEALDQHGRWRASSPIDAHPAAVSSPSASERAFRATLISEAGVLSTARNLAVSWCLGSIEPNPQGPGGIIIADKEAINLERYEILRTQLERAMRIWERHSRMNFVHLAGLDDRRKPSGGNCDTALEHVWFRAQTNKCNQYLQGQTNANGINEFDPTFGSPENPDGGDRLLCIGAKIIDASKLRMPWYASHETGHVAGLDHEHIRWDQDGGFATNCGDNDPYVPVSPDRILTPADPWSLMGYPECLGMEKSQGASSHDMLAAYYTFNWTERRIRDIAPQTGGWDQRLWAGNNRPGLLWYQPFSDRLLEWRFEADQPGPLAFDTVERCLDGGCTLTDSRGHWHPVMGQFAGSATALDVFMYGPDDTQDFLLRNDGDSGFEAIEAPAPTRAIPVVGNFGSSGTRDQILWYRPGPASEELWMFDESGNHETLAVDVEQDDWRIPLTGHFRSRTHWTDIIWFDPRDATVDTWLFNHDFSALKSGPASAEPLGVAAGTEYLPIIGNFDGDNRTDMFWYTPGSAPDWLWLSVSDQQVVNFDSYQFAVDGEYHPVVGDYDGDGNDDILWYRPMVETAGGLSWIWYFDGASVDVRSVRIMGDYVPYVEDFDGDGCTDIFWYDPVSPGDGSPIWRCLPGQKSFSCSDQVSAPKVAYPVGFATGGY